ncbi:MAG: nickel pincer cofactor biosynthesis protein LarC [Nitrospirae bacterium]|nr:nickel pincer cofactor biosynthesis protein LarC [Nitrospirota bacterium]MBF0534423.1 nickel pincer cofactor biosynthesis protein LarC [Nitrospirota bacterium]MBF0615596.1 nickel pincer cofactor biosynthesis protein LarC [Nitrospirota bacterium]
MKTCYIECKSGVSGDMLSGALIDAGVPTEYLSGTLKGLPLQEFEITSRPIMRGGIRGVKFDVRTVETGAERTWGDINEIYRNSTLSDNIRNRSLTIFESLFKAEGKVHGKSYDEVHLHELGAVDCMVDITSFVAGIQYLGVEEIRFSKINVGGGTVMTSHGTLPVPAPVTAELLKGVPIYSDCDDMELSTPTGAAIAKTMANGFTPMPDMTVTSVGYGCGEKDLSSRPNVLRVFVGETHENNIGERVLVIESNIDDMPGEIYGYLMERLFDAGALDVYFTPIVMKKSRPATKLTVICSHSIENTLSDIIFAETTTFGLRSWELSRRVLKREMKMVITPYGYIKVKTAIGHDGRVITVSPEYEDCKRVAVSHKIPLKRAMEEALKNFEIQRLDKNT